MKLHGMQVVIGWQSPLAASSGASSSGTSESSSGRGTASVFGMTCTLCGVKDDAPDNILPDSKRAWGYPPDPVTGRNVGKLCLLCFRVYRARFRGKYPSVDQLKAGFGKDGDLYKLWCYWSGIAETAMKEAGSSSVRIVWGPEDAVAVYHGTGVW